MARDNVLLADSWQWLGMQADSLHYNNGILHWLNCDTSGTYWFFKDFFFSFLHACVCVSIWHMCFDVLGGNKRVTDTLNLEIQGSLRCLLWVLGTEFEPSMRAVSDLNFWAISPSPIYFLKDQNCIYIKKITLFGELRHIATLHSLSLLILKIWFTYQPFSNVFSIFTNWKWFFYHALLLWIFFSVLGFEPRTLHVLGKPSTYSLYPWLPCLFWDFFSYTSHTYPV